MTIAAKSLDRLAIEEGALLSPKTPIHHNSKVAVLLVELGCHSQQGHVSKHRHSSTAALHDELVPRLLFEHIADHLDAVGRT